VLGCRAVGRVGSRQTTFNLGIHARLTLTSAGCKVGLKLKSDSDKLHQPVRNLRSVLGTARVRRSNLGDERLIATVGECSLRFMQASGIVAWSAGLNFSVDEGEYALVFKRWAPKSIFL
jgi:hypothetical protein